MENLKERLEKRDKAVLERQKIFANDDAKESKETDKDIQENVSKVKDLDQLKKVSQELMDIGVYYTVKGAERATTYIPVEESRKQEILDHVT